MTSLSLASMRSRAAPRTTSSQTDQGIVLAELGFEDVGGQIKLAHPEALSIAFRGGILRHLALIAATLHSDTCVLDEAHDVRFSTLVSECLDMDACEALTVATFCEEPIREPLRTPEGFHRALLDVIRQQRLHQLFTTAEGGQFHRGIVPAAYDECTGQVIGEEMAEWRAAFRAMAPERQMLAATIVWLYRCGPDSIWLRRVPCAWSAAEALCYLKDAGCLSEWLRLLALYPGW